MENINRYIDAHIILLFVICIYCRATAGAGDTDHLLLVPGAATAGTGRMETEAAVASAPGRTSLTTPSPPGASHRGRGGRITIPVPASGTLQNLRHDFFSE